MAPARSTASLQLGLGADHRREGGRSSAGAALVSAEWRALAERMGQGADASLPPARGAVTGVMEAEGVGKGVAAGEGVGVPEGGTPELDGVDRALGVPLEVAEGESDGVPLTDDVAEGVGVNEGDEVAVAVGPDKTTP